MGFQIQNTLILKSMRLVGVVLLQMILSIGVKSVRRDFKLINSR